MKKINKKEICIFIATLIFIASQILPKSVTNLDEIWIFNNANCIANGLIPYKDFNIIIGPLFPLMFGILLKIFGQEMIVTRIASIIFDTIIIFLTYKIMDKIEIKDYIKYIALIVLAYIMKNYFTFDYNWATLLIVLIIVYIEIVKREDSWKKDLFLGVLAGISITIKQTIGIILCIATIGYKILEVRNLKSFKKFIKSALIRLLGVFIVTAVFIIILLKLDCLNDYIDYCIAGIPTFINKISYLRLIKNKNLIIRFLSIIPSVVLLLLIITYIKKKDEKALILAIYSIINIIFVYPISDETHFVVGITITIIGIAYLINLIDLNLKIPKKDEIFINSFLICSIILIGIIYCCIRNN